MAIDWIWIGLSIVAMAYAYARLKAHRARRRSKPVASQTGKPPRQDRDELYRLARELAESIEETAHPRDVLEIPAFRRGVGLLSDVSEFPAAEILSYLKGDNWVISCMAGQALCSREDEQDMSEDVLAHIGYLAPWPLFFALNYVAEKSRGPVLGPVLARARDWWVQAPSLVQIFRDFAAERLRAGEQPTFGNALEGREHEELENIARLLEALHDNALTPARHELRAWQQTRVNRTALETAGRVWTCTETRRPIESSALLRHLGDIQASVELSPVRSVLVVGERGVGKTSLVRALACRLQDAGWTVFEAGASDLLAGHVHIGALEGHVKRLLAEVAVQRRVLWYIPECHELLHAGSHQYDPSGVLDQVLPAIEAGRIVVVGETTPLAYEHLVRARKRVRTALDTVRVQPLPDPETVALARAWVARQPRPASGELIDVATLGEAFDLVRQHLTEAHAPGNLLDFLAAACRHIREREDPQRRVTVDDLYTTLSQLTSLPRSILDDREELDIAALRRLFTDSVIGQDEAVDCLIERVAMVKAGLTDPARPLGVFLFVGPTGTGKTEIAKTLARFLFGTQQRLIRLDMSEFQDPESISRILGNPETSTGSRALVDLIRQQPFSVVLLDEFEKAHPKVWDLFLQVFDDGRLTDRAGNLADFRHGIIILTSNLGATVSPGTRIGFTQGDTSLSRAAVERAVTQTFRPEFLNRLDRVVVFRPLSRSVMREILNKELSDALLRRGIRQREWAVEWDEAAIDFLLEKGFTPDLGARPLKRAVERYLLAPLSLTIVEHRFPAGDQFLFVGSSGHALQVDFVDPDAPPVAAEAAEAPPAPREGREAGFELKALVLEPTGSPEEFAHLAGCFERLNRLISAPAWQTDKHAALARTGSAEFWDSTQRYAVLTRVELMDRIESGLRSAGSLLRRLSGPRGSPRPAYPRDLVRRLAEQLYLLEVAESDLREHRPLDAFLLVETTLGPNQSPDVVVDFFNRIAGMYERWAEKRRMRYRVLRKSLNDHQHCHSLSAVSGFGAFFILHPEQGLHVLEIPKDARSFQRIPVKVRTAPQPEVPVRDERELLLKAQAAFNGDGDRLMKVVRRYRNEPSPLVRDSARNWRTGRLDRVLGGDFDLIT